MTYMEARMEQRAAEARFHERNRLELIPASRPLVNDPVRRVAREHRRARLFPYIAAIAVTVATFAVGLFASLVVDALEPDWLITVDPATLLYASLMAFCAVVTGGTVWVMRLDQRDREGR